MSNFLTGSLLRKLREESNYSLQDIANYLGVSKPAVSKWENGYDIKTENLYSLAKLYGVKFSELYEGKLDSEPNDQYWQRNYDLSNYEINEEITSKNIDDVKNLFEHIKLVRDKFIELLPKWANNQLSIDEQEQFKLIKQYFCFDSNYYAYKEEGPGHIIIGTSDQNEMKFVSKVLKEMKPLSKKTQRWELEKIYNFTFDYHENLIHDSRNLKALEYMLSSFNQIEKDSILYANIHIKEEVEDDLYSLFGGTKKTKKTVERDRTVDEIESLPCIKAMLDSGANMLYKYHSNNNGWDDEAFEFADGKKVQIDTRIHEKHRFSNFAGQTYIPLLQKWKSYSYEQYLEFIDHKETERLNDIVNLRDKNPLEYFKKLVERGYK